MIDTTASDHKIISLPSSTPYVDIKSTPTPESKELIFKSINLPILPISITEAQACVIGDFIFIVGGGNQHYSNDLIRFNPKLNTFEMMANIGTPVFKHAVTAKDNQIFVFGGLPSVRSNGNQNQCYDMKTNTWSSKTPLSGERFGLSATTIEDKIYVSGGRTHIPISRSTEISTDLKIVEVYDLKTNSWEKIADMPGTKVYHRSVNIGNKLYIFDGNDGDQTAYVYDIFNKKWEQFPSLKEALPLNQPILHYQDFDALTLEDGRILPLSVRKAGAAAVAWQHRIFCFGKSIAYPRTTLPTGSNEVSSYLLLDKDLLAQAKTALPEWSGVYRSTSSQELIINEKGHVKFNDQDLFSMIFDVRTKTLYADKVGDTKDSFQSTFFISESKVKSCEGPSFTGKREASVPAPIPSSRFSTESTPTSPPSRPPGNFLLRFVTSDVVRAGYDGHVKVKLKMEYKITDEKAQTKTITKFTKETQLGVTSFDRNKIYSFLLWFKDDLDPPVLEKVEARTPKALTISPEANFWGDQWHVDQIAVIDLTYNITRLCRLSSEDSPPEFVKAILTLGLIALGFMALYRRAPGGLPNPRADFADLSVYHEENVLRGPTDSLSDYLLSTNNILANSEREYPLSDDFKQLEPESIKNISSELSVVYIWSFQGKFESWGHVALGLSDGTYISWWPQKEWCDLYLMSEFDIGQCDEIKEIKASDDNAANIVILTNQNTAYFIFKNKFVIKDDKPQAVEGINRQGISPSVSIRPIKYTGSMVIERKIADESLLKGGHKPVPVLPQFINDLVPALRNVFSIAAISNQTYEDDLRLERKHADITITIPDLGVAAIKSWWESFKNNPANKWESAGQNCAKTVYDALSHGTSLVNPNLNIIQWTDWLGLHLVSGLTYTPEYIMYLAYHVANLKFQGRNSSSFSIPENPGGGHVLSFMAIPRSIPDNKYNGEEKDHQEASPTTISDSPKLPPSVKLRYAMWGFPPPELMVKAPVQNERVLGK